MKDGEIVGCNMFSCWSFLLFGLNSIHQINVLINLSFLKLTINLIKNKIIQIIIKNLFRLIRVNNLPLRIS